MRFPPSRIAAIAFIFVLGIVPPVAGAMEEPFYTGLFLRLMILAIAAASLNFILGYGSMISFGHAAYVGIGAYVVGAGSFHAVEDGLAWVGNGFVQFGLAVAICGAVACVFGAISLRTRGVYFIMITLAFAQMLYFVAVALDIYGADDGLTLYRRSDFAPLVDLTDQTEFYYAVLAILSATFYLLHRVTRSRFGSILRASRSNEQRLTAIGVPVFRYKLAAFVIAAVIAGLAGALLANRTDFVSPAMMHWTRSGDLIVMVVLGGMGSALGPLYGAATFLLLEELLSSITEWWQIMFGPFLVLVVIYARGGMAGLLARLDRRDG
jgi:branched-chain amino acid transport system permease protein